jgi:hypothetical protein
MIDHFADTFEYSGQFLIHFNPNRLKSFRRRILALIPNFFGIPFFMAYPNSKSFQSVGQLRSLTIDLAMDGANLSSPYR